MITFVIGEEFDDMKPFSEEVSKVDFLVLELKQLRFTPNRSLRQSMKKTITWN